ncbi:MAG: RNA polymerase sigma factor [Planctomycetota bacterium]|nr:RNA polymerase sigma factor [Planctomycetota bacterium]
MAFNLDCESDKTLLEQLKSGDGDSFFLLYERYKNRVMRFAYILLQDEEAAGDVVFNTFLWFMDFLPDDANLLSLLLKKTRSFANALVKKSPDMEKRRKEHLERLSSSQQSQEGDFGPLLFAAFMSLSPLHRESIYLTMVEDLSYAEIGAVLECSTEEVGQRLNEALVAMREVLDKQGLLKKTSNTADASGGGAQDGEKV